MMNEGEATIIVSLLMLIPLVIYLFFAGRENASRYNEKQNNKTIKRYYKSKERFENALSLIDGVTSISDEYIFYKKISDVISSHNESLEAGDTESAGIVLDDFLSNYRESLNIITAKHPRNLIIEIADIHESISPVLVASEDLLGRRKPYLVNAVERTCTCSEFTSFGSNYLSKDIRRVCRHQVKVMKKEGILPKLSIYAELVISHGFRDQYYSLIDGERSKFLIGYSDSLNWVSVWVMDSKSLSKRYSFSMLEKRWSYGKSPKGFASDFRKAVRVGFGLQ